MSKKVVNELTPEIVLATKEARELFRVRNSFTFNLGIELIRSVKNPFLIFLLPFRLFSLLFFSKPQLPNVKSASRSGILIIGIDRIGQNFSLQSHVLAQIISESNLGDVTLLNNTLEPPKNIENVEWYRIPSVREKNKSRKEWNIMVERLLSSVVSISRPEHVIFFGDYLYRGVVDALGPLESSVPITWFLPSTGKSESISTKKLPKINPISLPEFNRDIPASQSIHRILRRSESERILLLDVAPKNKQLINSITQGENQFLITAVQREYPLPKGINLVVRMKEVIGMQLEGNVTLIIDDESPLVSSLAVLNVPCLLLRTGKILSPIAEEMIRDMELKGTLVVVRRNISDEIKHSLNYLFSIPYETIRHISDSSKDSPNQVNYVLKWLKKSNQPYN